MAPKIVSNIHKIVCNIHSPDGVHLVLTILWTILLRTIKPFLDMDAANTAAHAFVSSHLDARNSMLYNIAQGKLQCIQRIQNIAARIITDTRQYEHITPVLCHLRRCCA